MKKKILIVEDNEKLLQSLETLLEGQFQVLLAVDGSDGLQMARLHLPDLIISDIMMPLIDGYELTETLKKDDRTHHIPILLLTALNEDEKRITGYNHGADAYIAKPFKFNVLQARVHNLLRSRDHLRQVYDKSSPVNHDFNTKDPLLSHVESVLVGEFKFRDFSVPAIAEKVGIPPMKLERDIKRLTGMTPIKYINDYRLHCARELLLKGHKSVFEISHNLGFKSVSYFGKAYKEKYGVTPSKTASNA